MTFLKAALAVVAVTVLSGHVAPSVDDNNRYLKVTPLRNGVRVAYTVFFGEIPGASERKAIDTNRDGRIDDDEANRFAQKLGAEVAAAIDIEVDGGAKRLQWDVVSAGMGSDAVAAGSFSIDLVAFACGSTAASHTILVRDQFRIPRPGETEVKVEDTPGVSIQRAHVGPADDPSHDFRFAGPGGPLSDDGLELQFTTTDKSPTVPPGKCTADFPPGVASGLWWRWLVLGAVIAVALAAAAFVFMRRRRT